jgi:hypothetical protein
MKKKESKPKAETPVSDRRSFMKTLVTGTVATGLAATVGRADKAMAATPATTATCLSSALEPYFLEKNARSAAHGPAEYFEFDVGHQDIPGFPGGGIWVALAPSGSRGLTELRRLLQAREYERLGAVIQSYHQLVTSLVVDRRSPYASISEVPTLAEVTYAGKVVAGGLLVVPGSDVMLSFLPYNGGRLNSNAFRLTQYSRPNSSTTALEAVVIARKPVLTQLEQQILDRIPEEILSNHLGDGGISANWGLLAAGVVLVAGFVAGVFMADKAAQNVADQHAEQQRQMEQQMNESQNENNNNTEDDKNNGGSLLDWMTVTNAGILERMEVTAAATKLLQLRSNLVQGQLMGGA